MWVGKVFPTTTFLYSTSTFEVYQLISPHCYPTWKIQTTSVRWLVQSIYRPTRTKLQANRLQHFCSPFSSTNHRKKPQAILPWEMCFLWTFQNGRHSNSQDFLNAYISVTNAPMKSKLVFKPMFLWSSSPINMFVKTYKDFWLTKSKMATLYNGIRWPKMSSINYYFSLMMTSLRLA